MREEGKKGRRRGLCLLAGLLVLALTWGTMPVRVQAAKKDGWAKTGGKKYYYRKGKKVKGFTAIKGKTYFFNSKGVMQANQIVGNEKAGYHYAGKDGVCCFDPAIEAAKNLVLTLTEEDWSQKKKLETVFRYLVYDCSYAADYYEFTTSNFGSLALRMYARKAGDCNEGALLMAYVGRVLGYTSRLVSGYVNSYLTPAEARYLELNGESEHGWAEIMLGKQPYLVYDVSMQRAYQTKLYSISRAQYPYAIKAVAVYRLNVKNGKVVWG